MDFKKKAQQTFDAIKECTLKGKSHIDEKIIEKSLKEVWNEAIKKCLAFEEEYCCGGSDIQMNALKEKIECNS